MGDFIWDLDLRAILASLLGSGKVDSNNVDDVVALAVRYAQTLAQRRAERQLTERGMRDRDR